MSSKKNRDKALVLPNYPYLNKFSHEQTAAALDRKDRLVEAMTDAVGPDGTMIAIPTDMLHILAFHMAFAGCDVINELALIESRVVPNQANDNDYGLQWSDWREWRAKGEFGETTDDDTPTAAEEAKQIAAQLRSEFSPDVRAALAEIMTEDAADQAEKSRPTSRERAENVLREQEIRKLNREGGA